MPANVVKTPRDERLWNKAKKIAEKAGRDKDYAYIMGIYKQMKGMNKAYVIPEQFRLNRVYGRVPSRERLEAAKLAETPPEPFSVARLLAQDAPRHTPGSIISGLGFDSAQENDWTKFLENIMKSAINEVTMRQAVAEKCISDRLIAPLRGAILQRSLVHWRQVRKSDVVEVVTPDALLKSKYVRKWRDRGKWQYAYEKPESVRPGVKELRLNRAESRRVVEVFSVAKRKLTDSGISEKDAKKMLARDPVVASAAVKLIRDAIPSEFIARELVRMVKMNKSRPYCDESGNLFVDRDGTIPWNYFEHGSGQKIFVIDRTDPEQMIAPKNRSVPRRVPVRNPVRTPRRNPRRGPERNPRLMLDLEKAEARGGKYHRRIPKSGGGYRYVYDEEEYSKRKDAHTNGEENSSQYILNKVMSCLDRAGTKGCDTAQFQDLVKKYGAKRVGAVLTRAKSRGAISFKKGKFYQNKKEEDKKE